MQWLRFASSCYSFSRHINHGAHIKPNIFPISQSRDRSQLQSHVLLIRRGGSKSDYLEQLSLRLLMNRLVDSGQPGLWNLKEGKTLTSESCRLSLSAEALIAVINTVPWGDQVSTQPPSSQFNTAPAGRSGHRRCQRFFGDQNYHQSLGQVCQNMIM